MKKLFALFISFTLLIAVCACSKTPSETDLAEYSTFGLTYSMNADGGYTVTGVGVATDVNVVLPSMYGDLPVTAIGEGAFSDATFIRTLTMPDSVTAIEAEAFYGCSSLQEIKLSSSLEIVGNDAFSGCSSLRFVDFKESLTRIGSDVFAACTSLEYVMLPESLERIGQFSFNDCDKLSAVYYRGTKDGFERLEYEYFFNMSLYNATKYYYSANEPNVDAQGDFWRYVDGKPSVWTR